MQIVVSYEEASKNGDMSALTCFKDSKNNIGFEMVVGAVSGEADEIFEIVSKQGYLKKHDSALLDKVAESITEIYKCNLYCAEDYCDKERCQNAEDCFYGTIIKAIERMKAGVEE